MVDHDQHQDGEDGTIFDDRTRNEDSNRIWLRQIKLSDEEEPLRVDVVQTMSRACHRCMQ